MTAKKSPQNSSAKTTDPVQTQETTINAKDAKPTDSELAIEVLQQAYDALSEEFNELKVDHESLRDFVEANLSVKGRLNKLDRNLLRHKHERCTGEAMLPMEAP